MAHTKSMAAVMALVLGGVAAPAFAQTQDSIDPRTEAYISCNEEATYDSQNAGADKEKRYNEIMTTCMKASGQKWKPGDTR